MSKLWTKSKEIEFFEKSFQFAAPEQLFYVSSDNRYFAYWPKTYKGKKTTLQSRNSLIGNFTEKYSVDLLQDFARKNNLFAVQGIVCNDIGLSTQSSGDVAICKTKEIEQEPCNIVLLFEVKMSIVWNWELRDGNLICLGDYKTHKGNPGLLRSDSMLKAIGKSINIRVSGYKTSNIPIIILGNTPITLSYEEKVDHLLKAGIIQGFWSINPSPLDNNGENIKYSPEKGFVRVDNDLELESMLNNVLSGEKEFFSAMKTKSELGRIIQYANNENSFEEKAEKFLRLIRE
jgi:hypothetical protein